MTAHNLWSADFVQFLKWKGKSNNMKNFIYDSGTCSSDYNSEWLFINSIHLIIQLCKKNLEMTVNMDATT